MADMTFTIPDAILPYMKELGVARYGLDPNCTDAEFNAFLSTQFVNYTRAVVTEYQLQTQVATARDQATQSVYSNMATIFGDPTTTPPQVFDLPPSG